ncbi:hypothetical protein VUR80DRAFT_1707 [Thermomyces stellatus]
MANQGQNPASRNRARQQLAELATRDDVQEAIEVDPSKPSLFQGAKKCTQVDLIEESFPRRVLVALRVPLGRCRLLHCLTYTRPCEYALPVFLSNLGIGITVPALFCLLPISLHCLYWEYEALRFRHSAVEAELSRINPGLRKASRRTCRDGQQSTAWNDALTILAPDSKG